MPVSTSNGSRGRVAEAVVWVCGCCAAGAAGDGGDACGDWPAAAGEAVEAAEDGDEDGMRIVGGLLLGVVRLGAVAPCPEEEPVWCSCAVGAAVVAGAAARTVIPAVMFGWTVQT
jgi:hypothetical protein